MSYDAYQKNRKKADKFNRKVAVAALKSFGITMVEYTFYGGNDDGSIEEAILFKGSKQLSRDKADDILKNNKYPCKDCGYGDTELRDEIEPLEDLVNGIGYEAIEQRIPGWSTSNGANGTVKFHVDTNSFLLRGEVSEPVAQEFIDKNFPDAEK